MDKEGKITDGFTSDMKTTLHIWSPSSCGELTRFTHKKVRFAHFDLFINIKCPPINVKLFSPSPLNVEIFVPPSHVKMFAPPFLWVRNVCPPGEKQTKQTILILSIIKEHDKTKLIKVFPFKLGKD